MNIYKITDAEPVDFAAGELKKYLRMMMPDGGDVRIACDRTKTDGFRLGVLRDFGIEIPEEAALGDAFDEKLDDVLHIEAGPEGGIIAGSNPRSVLLAVYKFLALNGCRWLFPGVDGEVIPLQGLKAVSYHQMAGMRYRGQCNEGAEAQINMLETIDFAPKIGLNTYMLEFDVPMAYYNLWYSHKHNPFKEPEPLSPDTVRQWKRVCETEIAKRGLLFHDMGHGWTGESFGIDTKGGWNAETRTYPEDVMQYVAMVDGKRSLFGGVPLNTNFCMSNPDARGKVVQYVADYAESHQNVDFLHIWLADGTNNHCECPACAEKTTSDWYILLLNEIDAELTRRHLDTHLVFIAYHDLSWAPETERLQSEKRFTLLFAPITRTYTQSYAVEADADAIQPNVRNHLVQPHGMPAALAYLEAWQKVFSGDCFVYEYHFWNPICRDPGMMALSRCVAADIQGMGRHRLRGSIEDQTQRFGFPTGFPIWLYGMLLFDPSLDYEALRRDYFSHAYGRDWERAAAYLEKVSDMFDFAYLLGDRGGFLCPEHRKDFDGADALFTDMEAYARQRIVSDRRAESVSWQMLVHHARYCRILARCCAERCVGNMEPARAAMEELRLAMARDEDALQRYFDLGLYCNRMQPFIQ